MRARNDSNSSIEGRGKRKEEDVGHVGLGEMALMLGTLCPYRVPGLGSQRPPIWKLRTVCDSTSRGSNSLTSFDTTGTYLAHKQTHRQRLIHIK